jgi:hypothetical protein
MIWGSIADEPQPCGRASCKNRLDRPAAAPQILEIAVRAGWKKSKCSAAKACYRIVFDLILVV